MSQERAGKLEVLHSEGRCKLDWLEMEKFSGKIDAGREMSALPGLGECARGAYRTSRNIYCVQKY